MFHRRCKEIETILREELEEARTRIATLEQELDMKLHVSPLPSIIPGRVVYMDDERMARLEGKDAKTTS